ncbi:uncharacterized protein LOC121238153 [Juglans microcarpa x Juglans regia]|uniref:uncharacterized protein LOC121238153 n=1 Tax=Juglans microcarpa x Juglans regia TaxID=2249226 RepID=UPI001B7E0AF9|nr:uncharacterized protein LOC121238153 [Juglans microcarpa x Juglans regia]
MPVEFGLLESGFDERTGIVHANGIKDLSATCKVFDEMSNKSRSGFNRGQTVYHEIYSPWTIDPFDAREVVLYSMGLEIAALSFVFAALASLLLENFMSSDIIKQNLDLFYTVDAGGLGLFLFFIHIYINEIKRTLQALWGLGAIGSLATYTVIALLATMP